jgi:hypothetical protein
MADNEEIKKLNDELENLQSKMQSIAGSLTDRLNNTLSSAATEAEKLVDAFEKGENVTKKLGIQLDKVQTKNNQLSLNRVKLESDLSKAQATNNTASERKIRLALYQNKLAIEQLDSTTDLLLQVKQINKEKEKENSLSNQAKKAYDSLEKSISSQIGFSLTLSGIFSAILQAAFKIDAQVVELSKSLGVSKKEAQEISSEFNSYAVSLGDGFTTLTKLTQAQSDLTKQIGVAVKYTNEEVGMFAKLTGLYGLTADEAGNLTRYSASHGKNIKEYTGSLLKASKLAQIETGTRFDQREILQDIAKLSSGILVKFQGNPKALAAAVVEAKKLGTNLETVDKIGESLLNFESSIENELKAELLTGKQINLEKARYAALTGNQLDLTREIASQVGTLNEYENMNVLAQKSLAEAFGLSRDEMSEMLLKQEAINKYGDKAAELNAQELEDLEKQGISIEEYQAKQLEQVEIQKQFNTLVENLQTTLGQLAGGPLMSLVSGFASLLNNALVLYPLVATISALMVGKMLTGTIEFGKSLALAIPKMATLVGLSSAKAVAEITAAEAMTLGLATIGIVAGIAAAVAAMNSAKSEAQSVSDGIAPPGKGPFTITDSFGNTAITDKGDGIAVSPNISKTNGMNNTSMDLSPMISAINEVRSAVDRLYSKDTSINMDGKKVGNTLTQGSYKVA